MMDISFTVSMILDNLNVSLDYVINRLTDDDADPGNPYPDQIRMTLGISF